MLNVNCIYTDGNRNQGQRIWCTNKKVKRSFFIFGARICIENAGIKTCPFKKEHTKPKAPPPPPKRSATGFNNPEKVVEFAKEISGLDASVKLVTLADACSASLYDSECSWERINFDTFVADCKKAITLGINAKNSGFTLKEG